MREIVTNNFLATYNVKVEQTCLNVTNFTRRKFYTRCDISFTHAGKMCGACLEEDKEIALGFSHLDVVKSVYLKCGYIYKSVYV